MADAAQDVFFSKDLNLVNTGREAYNTVIVFLRQRLIGSRYFHDNPNSPLAHTWYSHNLPVLRPELEADPVPWFDLVVQTSQNRVTFKLRRDNLYVVGYQVNRTTGNDQWREFTRKDPQGNTLPSLIDPNSILLPFGGAYQDMEGYGKVSLGKTSVGQQDLIKAVNLLATTTTTDAVRAQSLIVVIFMISESTRFRQVSDFISTIFDYYLGSARVDSAEPYVLADLVKDWDKLSAALLRVDAGFDFYITEPHYARIEKEMDAVAVLGILKYHSFRKNSNATSTSTLPVTGPGPFSTT